MSLPATTRPNLDMGAPVFAAIAPTTPLPVDLVTPDDPARRRPMTIAQPLPPMDPRFGTDVSQGTIRRRPAPDAPVAAPAPMTPLATAPQAPAAAQGASPPVSGRPGGLGGLGGWGDVMQALGQSMMTGGHGDLFGRFPQAMEGIRARRAEEAEKGAQAQAIRALGREMGFSDEEIAQYGNDPAFIKAAYELRERAREQAERERMLGGARAMEQGLMGGGAPAAPAGGGYVPLGDFSAYEEGAQDQAPPAVSAPPVTDDPTMAQIGVLNDRVRQYSELAARYEQAGDPIGAARARGYAEQFASERDLLADRLPKDSGEGGEFGLTPVYMQDPETGDMVLGQLSKNGGFTPIESGGLVASPGVQRIDLGTSWGILNRSGEVVGTVEKDVAGEQREQAVGRAEGETIANAPAALRNAEAVISVIDNVLASPGRGAGTGFSRIFNAPFGYTRPGSDTANFEVARDQLQGQAFLQAYESLKGGGQITEVEGLKAEQAEARLNPNQSDEEFERALREMRDIAERARDRAAQLLAGESVRLPDGRLLLPNGTAQGQEAPSEIPPAPEGVSPEEWQAMTPEERALWQN